VRGSNPRFNWFEMGSLLTGVIAGLVSLVGAMANRQQFFHSYLFAWLFWSGISFGALLVIMMQFLTGGAWGLAVARLADAAMGLLPWMALLFVPILIGIGDIYSWTHGLTGDTGSYHHKQQWLNLPFFISRSVIYFALLASLALLLRRWSLREPNALEPGMRLRALSSGGLILYVLCMNFASTDWVMSLTPEWYSTIFVVVFMAGHFLTALALLTGLLAWVTWSLPSASGLPTKVFSDLGNMLLAFVIFWTYVTFSQLLIIWSGNLPKEISWYLPRSSGGWQWLAVALAAIEFALPFALLLFRPAKRNPKGLAMICACILVGGILNNYWLVAPSFHPEGFYFHWMDFTLFLALGGIWFALFIHRIKERAIIPPTLPEAPHHG